ncbi:MAG: asparagine synthase (glutamine-hydrolyzing), partial [Deltaproteobacteria bacterium]|nr:asparagine synthase (glutamine-hydrolyzing) [Deltaproteobacteria bacterium]
MCGILGAVPLIPEHLFHNALNSLAHRGPDDEGIWQDHEHIILGHRRLSVLDLSLDGRQPMCSRRGRFVIVFNGEIYNFIEIKTELEGTGYNFKTRTDTEVLLTAFEEWGEKCLNRLNGMWAFAVWDTKEKKLFLTRDRFGKKPLFYVKAKEKFIFASEMKALFPFLPQVMPSRDFLHMARYPFRYESTDACVIEGIKRFPAGHYAWYEDGEMKFTRYWNTLDHLVDPPSRFEEQVEYLRDLFLDACKIRMRSDVAIGTALSGGLDSSSIICAMAHLGRQESDDRMARDWQHAFVACFPDTPLDESGYAKTVTDHIGVKAEFIEIDPLKVLGKLGEYLYLFEDLYITSPVPFMVTYGEMRKNGIKVTVDGHGADECFGGYESDYLFALKDAGLNIAKIRSILNTWHESFPEESLQFKPGSRVLFWVKWQFEEMLRAVLPGIQPICPDKTHPNWKRLDNLTRQLYISTHVTVLPTLLRNYDRYSMANGVEIRMPFLDYRIVTLAFSLPWTSKIRNGFSKAIIRDALSGYIPDEIVRREEKIGF